MNSWNPWHGCHKISEGCQNCYVYGIDGRHGCDAAQVHKTQNFNLPLRQTRAKAPKLAPGSTVFTCFTSDFFLAQADEWRSEAWRMMRIREDLIFFIITKRIDRFNIALPADWGAGYDNVAIACTTECQRTADYRLPIYRELPIKHKSIICAPLLGPLDLRPYLGGWLDEVSVGGESGLNARVCDYNWVLDIRAQCMAAGVGFNYHQTGARLLKDGRLYRVPKKLQRLQAKKAAIDWAP